MEFRAKFVDIHGRTAPMSFRCASDADAVAVANALAAKSNASWVGLQKLEDVAVDSAAYANYQDGSKPTAGSTVRSQGQLFYGVQSRRNQLKVTIPAVLETLLSSAAPTIGTDPISGVGKLIDEEAVATTSFVRGKFKWGHRKGK